MGSSGVPLMWLFSAGGGGGLGIGRKQEVVQREGALRVFSLVVTEAAHLFRGPLFQSGSDVQEASCSSKKKKISCSSTFFVIISISIEIEVLVKVPRSATAALRKP